MEEDRVGEILFEGEVVGGSGVGGHGRKWRVASEEWRAVIRMREVEALRWWTAEQLRSFVAKKRAPQDDKRSFLETDARTTGQERRREEELRRRMVRAHPSQKARRMGHPQDHLQRGVTRRTQEPALPG